MDKILKHKSDLTKAKEVLESMGIEFYIVCGTLLGYYREGTFISHDRDMDIAVNVKDYTPKIQAEMERAGFNLLKRFGTEKSGLEMSYYKNSKLDIFFTYDEKDHTWLAVHKDGVVIKYKYPKPILRKVNLEGVEVLAPQLEYVTLQYGEDWLRPDTEWSWSESPKNIDDSDYWHEYYKNRKNQTQPSDFARFILDYIRSGSKVLEIGSGDGRDTYFLSQHANVLGVDNANKPRNKGKAKFLKQDLRDLLKDMPDYDAVYMRFFIHSIPEQLETELIRRLEGRILIEARTATDKLENPDHFRRYIDPEKLLNKLKDNRFEIVYQEVSRGWAKHGDEDPEVIRIVADKETNHGV